jgi:DNA-binding response OmpR family regulator
LNETSHTSSAHVLVVEHDARLRESICAGLGLGRYTCETVVDAVAALRQAEANAFDLIVVDLGAPHVGRLQLCRTLRQQPLNRNAPIVMIAASNALTEALAEMESGADDFLVTPFLPGELAARAKTAIHRSRASRTRETGTAVPAAEASPAVKHGDIQVDPARRHVRIKDRRVTLTEQEFHLLYVLARHAGVVFSRDGLLSQIWGSDRFVTVRSVDTLVSRLRRRIEPDNGDHPQYVLTVRGVGYKLGDSSEA